MRICETYASLLDPFVDGELSPAEADRVRAHLETCRPCRAYVDDALAIRAAFPDLEDTAVPEGFAQGVLEAVGRLEAEAPAARARKTVPFPRGGKRAWARLLLPLASCIAIAVLALPLGGRGGRATAPQAALTGGAAAPSGDFDGAASAGTDGTCFASDDAVPEPQEAPAALEEDSGDRDAAKRNESGLYTASGPAEDRESASEETAPSSVPDGPVGISPAMASGETAPDDPGSAPVPAPSVQIPPDQADLLAGYPEETDEEGVTRWRLTAEEYGALLSSLADRNVPPPPETDPGGGEILVYLAEG